ncbi:MAG: hypothetical protein WCB85_05055 [Candidatus Dormiibacterota bacterium]
MTTFVDVTPVRDPGWSKEAAVRASQTTRVSQLLNRLLADLARLDNTQQPRLDYLEPAALDAVRSDPETYHLIGRAASTLDEGGDGCVTAAYWPEDDAAEIEVEMEVADAEVVWGPALAPLPAPPLSHRLNATVDCREGRIERLALG